MTTAAVDSTPASTSQKRRTILIVGGVGFLIFLLMVGFAGYLLWQKYSHTQNWTPVTATVESVETLCQVQKKSGKSWDTLDILPCDQARKIAEEQSSVLTPWRTVEADYATITWIVSGASYRTRLLTSQVSDAPVAAGQQVPMFVDPADPNVVEKPFSSSDLSTFWIISGIGLAAWVLAMLIGWFVASMNGRYNSRLASSALVAAQNPLAATVGAVAAVGVLAAAPAAADAPLWAKILRFLAWAILILGVVFAIAAGIASVNDGNRDGQIGSLIILGAAVVVWAILWAIARAGGAGQPAAAARHWGR